MATQPALNEPAAESKKTLITAASTGGLIAAVFASLCCIGPVVFAALGVAVGATGFLADTAGVLRGLLLYRPLFLGLAALCFGISFYLAYRAPCGICAPGSVCPPAASTRFTRRLLWTLAVLAVALISAPYWLGL
jgi:mercuric ion transport protein